MNKWGQVRLASALRTAASRAAPHAPRETDRALPKKAGDAGAGDGLSSINTLYQPTITCSR